MARRRGCVHAVVLLFFAREASERSCAMRLSGIIK